MTALTDSLKDVLSVGIKQIDDEHAQLFVCLDRLMLSVNTRKGERTSAEVLTSLQAYAETHFRSEEALMATHAFPALEMHRREHQTFVDAILRFQRLADDPQANTPQQMTVYLMQWLMAHIQGSDKMLAAHIRTRGGE